VTRITEKGQVTIPQAIREPVGLLPYPDVEFRADDTVRLRKGAQDDRRGTVVVTRARGKATTRLTTNESCHSHGARGVRGLEP
jgi:bifunctional DNA-binding transcriptional regulator/antitoxin component of YhaV-PrlF toxin-antitoxin module